MEQQPTGNDPVAAAGSGDDAIARRVVLPVDMEAAFEDEAFLGLLVIMRGA